PRPGDGAGLAWLCRRRPYAPTRKGQRHLWCRRVGRATEASLPRHRCAPGRRGTRFPHPTGAHRGRRPLKRWLRRAGRCRREAESRCQRGPLGDWNVGVAPQVIDHRKPRNEPWFSYLRLVDGTPTDELHLRYRIGVKRRGEARVSEVKVTRLAVRIEHERVWIYHVPSRV